MSGKIEEQQVALPYQSLSQIYDRMMSHVPYRRWARYVQKILRQEGLASPRILDVGCGTGRFIREVGKLGLRADGCDASEEMLHIARQRNPSARFWNDQLPELTRVPAGKYAVFTCLYDTLNYLLSLQEVEQALRRVFQLLPPGGLFIFDVVSIYYCQTVLDRWREAETFRKDLSYQRYSYFDSGTRCQVSEFTIYTPDGVFFEKHRQRIYRFKELERLIRRKTAFDIVAIYEGFSFVEAEETSDRAHFVLRKSSHD